MGRLGKRISLSALVGIPLLVGATLLFSGKDKAQEEKIEPLLANNSYVENRAKFKKERFTEWLEGTLETKRKERRGEELTLEEEKKSVNKYGYKSVLDDRIEHLGYNHLRSNVGSLEEAQIICLGEVHKICGNEESLIFSSNFIKKYDEILVEGAPPLILDFPAMGKEREEMKKRYEQYREKESQRAIDILKKRLERKSNNDKEKNLSEVISGLGEGMEDSIKGIGLLMDSLDKMSEKIFYTTLQDGNERHFYSALARKDKGIVIGVDAEMNVKLQHLYSIIENSFLPIARANILEGSNLHPFFDWMVYDSLNLGVRGDPSITLKKIDDYISSIPSRDQCIESRDVEIRRNTIREVLNNKEGTRSWFIFGSNHLNEKLFDELERNRIGYVAFIPDHKKVAADSYTPNQHGVVTEEQVKQHGVNYAKDHLLPWYIKSKVKSGSPEYKGDFNGLENK
jgi:hypothetical protein